MERTARPAPSRRRRGDREEEEEKNAAKSVHLIKKTKKKTKNDTYCVNLRFSFIDLFKSK